MIPTLTSSGIAEIEAAAAIDLAAAWTAKKLTEFRANYFDSGGVIETFLAALAKSDGPKRLLDTLISDAAARIESLFGREADRRAGVLEKILRSPYMGGTIPLPHQLDFVCLDCREALAGGGKGGGKSVSLLMSALLFVDVPGYNAMILRKSFADMMLPKAIIPVSMTWLGKTNAKYTSQDHKWTFPTGATLQFGHCETESDVIKYQGSAPNFLGYDELSHFSKDQYTLIQAGLRQDLEMAKKLPLRIRATANPGGEGHAFIFEHFVDPATSTCPVTGAKRVYIPSKLDDNTYIDIKGYEPAFASMDPIMRKQLREGDWMATATGGTFKQAWLRYFDRTTDGKDYILHDGIAASGTRRIVGPLDCQRFVAADIAATEKQSEKEHKRSPDFSVIGLFDLSPEGDLILADFWLGQVEAPAVEDQLTKMMWDNDVPNAFIESNGMGLPIIQSVRRRNVLVTSVHAKHNKVARAQAAQQRMYAGRLFLPRSHNFMAEMLHQLLAFPMKGVHDDCVDCLTVASMAAMRVGGPLTTTRDAEVQHQQERDDAEKMRLDSSIGARAESATEIHKPTGDPWIDLWLSGRAA